MSQSTGYISSGGFTNWCHNQIYAGSEYLDRALGQPDAEAREVACKKVEAEVKKIEAETRRIELDNKMKEIALKAMKDK